MPMMKKDLKSGHQVHVGDVAAHLARTSYHRSTHPRAGELMINNKGK